METVRANVMNQKQKRWHQTKSCFAYYYNLQRFFNTVDHIQSEIMFDPCVEAMES